MHQLYFLKLQFYLHLTFGHTASQHGEGWAWASCGVQARIRVAGVKPPDRGLVVRWCPPNRNLHCPPHGLFLVAAQDNGLRAPWGPKPAGMALGGG